MPRQRRQHVPLAFEGRTYRSALRRSTAAGTSGSLRTVCVKSFSSMRQRNAFGKRRRFSITLLSDLGRYPGTGFVGKDVLLDVSSHLVYTVVPYEPLNEYEFAETAWTTLGNIRFGALSSYPSRRALASSPSTRW